MAFDLGSIRATLGLDESNYVRGMINAEAASEIFGSSVVQFVNNPLLGTIRLFKDVTAGIARTVIETARSNKELADWADRLGVSTEALSALSLEARGLGIEVEDVADTIGEFGVKARDAVNGSEDLLNTFARIGVSVTDRHGELRGLEDILLDVARGLSEVENETERFAIADELASDGAKRLLPILERLGREGYDPLIDRARAYGFVLDRDAAEASRNFQRSINALNSAMEGIKRNLATGFIEGAAGEIGNADIAAQNLALTINTRLTPAAKRFGEAMGSALSKIEEADQFFAELDQGFEGLDSLTEKSKFVKFWERFFDAQNTGPGLVKAIIENFGTRLGELSVEIESRNNSASRPVQDMQRVVEQRERESSRALGG